MLEMISHVTATTVEYENKETGRLMNKERIGATANSK